MGILTRLMSSILERGRGRGATTAEISVLIGNDSAQRAYEKAGFVVAAEARDADYEATFGCPGVRLLRMAL
jgi:ribosomal protein S18 acetylase RimI-like enzyme